ncbi:MAG: hypothetical protein WC784_01635 [Candidatus Shapirobacteria bacterium]|jgi:hypothetical protein
MVIFREIKKHPLNYLILGIIFIISVILFLYFRQSFDAHDQRRVVYITAGLYLFWSLFHHYRRGDLQLSIILEYALLALFAVIVALTTLV